jgi:hypothetical protein
MSLDASEPLWIGQSRKVTAALRFLGAEAITSDELTANSVAGREVIIAPSAAKRDGQTQARREAQRALKLGARAAAIVARPPYGADVADYAETANGHANLERILNCAERFAIDVGEMQRQPTAKTQTKLPDGWERPILFDCFQTPTIGADLLPRPIRDLFVVTAST